MNVNAMLTTWKDQFGMAAWLPVLRGAESAFSRAMILASLRGVDQVPLSDAVITNFRREVAQAFGVDINQPTVNIDEDILNEFHSRVRA